MKSFQVIAALLFVTIALASASRSAYFVITDGHNEFNIKLSDAALIAHARGLISGSVTEQQHIMGTIVKKDAWYNPEWSFYMNPTTISFFDMAMEVCDSAIITAEEHLAEVGGSFLPGSVWCPWYSRVVREL
ncbi:hypothetical protein SAMD00019534_121680 [Acytostelium subglobosum LB1]|uniref:hypothetical protein n=1 Tax=Acytostelium subglobosum LB1 TaxID=1410327 RepID=UPI000644E8C8|nr:hypothetical protein SAMD00019534_121680 [Acytostelium subglobosum LB1]GAM28992.1 hypothetical protein SAMD00019534_121680 [Acytostelium subglobosum LB1]|eukprot:XP_012747998.1 hypothetical protein SAMD00019534_121680 [Acytostelium subglobosum LB1]